MIDNIRSIRPERCGGKLSRLVMISTILLHRMYRVEVFYVHSKCIKQVHTEDVHFNLVNHKHVYLLSFWFSFKLVHNGGGRQRPMNYSECIV